MRCEIKSEMVLSGNQRPTKEKCESTNTKFARAHLGMVSSGEVWFSTNYFSIIEDGGRRSFKQIGIAFVF